MLFFLQECIFYNVYKNIIEIKGVFFNYIKKCLPTGMYILYNVYGKITRFKKLFFFVIVKLIWKLKCILEQFFSLWKLNFHTLTYTKLTNRFFPINIILITCKYKFFISSLHKIGNNKQPQTQSAKTPFKNTFHAFSLPQHSKSLTHCCPYPINSNPLLFPGGCSAVSPQHDLLGDLSLRLSLADSSDDESRDEDSDDRIFAIHAILAAEARLALRRDAETGPGLAYYADYRSRGEPWNFISEAERLSNDRLGEGKVSSSRGWMNWGEVGIEMLGDNFLWGVGRLELKKNVTLFPL